MSGCLPILPLKKVNSQFLFEYTATPPSKPLLSPPLIASHCQSNPSTHHQSTREIDWTATSPCRPPTIIYHHDDLLPVLAAFYRRRVSARLTTRQHPSLCQPSIPSHPIPLFLSYQYNNYSVCCLLLSATPIAILFMFALFSLTDELHTFTGPLPEFKSSQKAHLHLHCWDRMRDPKLATNKIRKAANKREECLRTVYLFLSRLFEFPPSYHYQPNIAVLSLESPPTNCSNTSYPTPPPYICCASCISPI